MLNKKVFHHRSTVRIHTFMMLLELKRPDSILFLMYFPDTYFMSLYDIDTVNVPYPVYVSLYI